ncbi:MAG TPA: helix-turn-helix domain-containing protein [Solimonas sp.]
MTAGQQRGAPGARTRASGFGRSAKEGKPGRGKSATAKESPADAIVDAAARCFQRWGIARTRIEDIASEVGIVRPHIYRHFESKEAIVHAVVLREIRHHHRRLGKRFPLRGPAEPLILGCLISGIFDAAKDSDTAFLVETDGASLTARMLASSAAVVAEVSQHWTPLLEYAKQRGELLDGLDIPAATRWLTFLEFSHLALPELTPKRGTLTAQFKCFVIPALLKPLPERMLEGAR